MAEQIITIDAMLGGQSPSQHLGGKTTFNTSIAIDPDFADVGSGIKTSASIYPVVYTKFSGSEIDGDPYFIITNPKDSNSYVYTNAGKLHGFDSSLSMLGGSFPITQTGGAGNGAAYYNNYIYLAEGTDITRYGPLNNSPSETENVWTGSTLGSQSALTDTTYPSIRGAEIPNHPMHVHVDNVLYFGDVVNGQGVIHRIVTKKTTDEGDTDNNSAFNVLDLPFGFLPTALESYGTDLVILAIQTTNATINQGQAMLFFWDTIAESFYRQVPVADPLGTALKNHNGVLYVWSGNAQNGCRLSAYVGGEQLQDLVYMEEGAPPMSGAVDALGNRVIWGGYVTYPEAAACVFAYGSKSPQLGKSLMNVARATSSGDNQNVTAVKFVQQDSNKQPKMIIGWGDDSAMGLDKFSASATIDAFYRSDLFDIGKEFSIKRVEFSLQKAVAANMTITPKIYLDDLSSNVSLTTINNTNYPNGEKKIVLEPHGTAYGDNNFLLELNFSGTSALPVNFPIRIIVDINDNG